MSELISVVNLVPLLLLFVLSLGASCTILVNWVRDKSESLEVIE